MRDWQAWLADVCARCGAGCSLGSEIEADVIACIPAKAMVSAAAKGLDYDAAFAHKDSVVGLLRDKNYHMLADNQHITLFEGVGSFVGPDTVAVRAGTGEILLKAARIFINTGAQAIIPEIPGVQDTAHVYTSTEMLDQAMQPKRLAIIGGGYTGLEFASTYAALGTEVTVFDHGEVLIKREDPEISAAVAAALEAQGVRIVLSAEVQSVADADGKVAVQVNGETDVYDAVLLATGRKPVTEELNLEAAGVELDERGAIKVDDLLRTTPPHIWALGDVNGGPQFTYASYLRLFG